MKSSYFLEPHSLRYRFPYSRGGLREGPEPRRRVVIVERRLTHYRVPFFNRLRALLEAEGIELQLLIGAGKDADARRRDLGTLDWAIPIPTYQILNGKICWQPFGAYARAADLVIINHENKLLYNLWLLFFRRPHRLAFWGHGRNMQSHAPNGMKELFKRWTLSKADWWFAYTDMTAELVATAGFPRESVTVVQNAADTNEMMELCDKVNNRDCQRLRKQLQLGSGPIGLYLGSLYREKRLDFLLEAAHRIHQRIPSFQLVIAGGGQEQDLIEAAAAHCPWIHYAGPLHGKGKAVALVLADVLLNPGAVGLGIQDSFVGGAPMFTTDCGLHGPEISYLDSGKNGIMSANDLEEYAAAVVEALSHPETLEKLRRGTLASAPAYTVENMAERFKQGVLACLSA